MPCSPQCGTCSGAACSATPGTSPSPPPSRQRGYVRTASLCTTAYTLRVLHPCSRQCIPPCSLGARSTSGSSSNAVSWPFTASWGAVPAQVCGALFACLLPACATALGDHANVQLSCATGLCYLLYSPDTCLRAGAPDGARRQRVGGLRHGGALQLRQAAAAVQPRALPGAVEPPNTRWSSPCLTP